jgi:hypothetical protein
MLQACRAADMVMSVQNEPDFDDEKKKKYKEIEQLMSEKDSEIRALKNELEVRNVITFHTNFMGTFT